MSREKLNESRRRCVCEILRESMSACIGWDIDANARLYRAAEARMVGALAEFDRHENPDVAELTKLCAIASETGHEQAVTSASIP